MTTTTDETKTENLSPAERAKRLEITNPTYEGMSTSWKWGGGYSLDGDAFTDDLCQDITEKTGIRKSDWLGDWFTHPEGNPQLTWRELVLMAVGILQAKATHLYVHHLYLGHWIKYDWTEAELYEKSVSGAKRVNAVCGEFSDFTGLMGLDALNFIRGGGNMEAALLERSRQRQSTGSKFRLHGKDSSCHVEGTWYHWVCFACNVLASHNTERMAPALYDPALANSTY